MKNPKIEKAAETVCRNPQHMPQVITLLIDSLSPDRIDTMSVDKLVEHWWKEQLFLGINLDSQAQVR